MSREIGEMSIATRVVHAVARANGDEPTELQPLTEVVDADALNQLFETSSNVKMELQFEYEGQTVSIDHTGEVSLQPVGERR